MSTTANVTDPIKPTTKGVPFWIFVVAVVVLLTGPIAFPKMCEWWLSPEQAPLSTAFYMRQLEQLASWIAMVAGTVTLGGSLGTKFAKLWAQLSPDIPTPATDPAAATGVPPPE